MKTDDVKDVSYIVFESTLARLDRIIKRLWVVILILVFLLVGSNAAWLYYGQQFKTVEESTQTVEQKADGESNNSFIGGDSNVGVSENSDN